MQITDDVSIESVDLNAFARVDLTANDARDEISIVRMCAPNMALKSASSQRRPFVFANQASLVIIAVSKSKLTVVCPHRALVYHNVSILKTQLNACVLRIEQENSVKSS